ncbi:MAG: aminotransferase class IV [Gemmatimonadota bacterium]|nr:aminotransferase class IV [Gemmatimonadota bacterium]
MIIYLDGRYLPIEEATVSVNDRAFLFADAVYEAVPLYRGIMFLPGRHLERLAGGLAELRIDLDPDGLRAVCDGLVTRNDLAREEFAVFYAQVTRGAAPRSHAFPKMPVKPTVYAFASPLVRPAPEVWEKGFSAITLPDQRWARADIKSTALLPNVLAQQTAVEAGVTDAAFVRDGTVTEGTHNNVFAVIGGVLVTARADHRILHGVTRGFVIELSHELGIPVEERDVSIEEFRRAEEIFFTGTTTEIRPTVVLDGTAVGDGTPGPVTRRIADAYRRAVDRAAGIAS